MPLTIEQLEAERDEIMEDIMMVAPRELKERLKGVELMIESHTGKRKNGRTRVPLSKRLRDIRAFLEQRPDESFTARELEKEMDIPESTARAAIQAFEGQTPRRREVKLGMRNGTRTIQAK